MVLMPYLANLNAHDLFARNKEIKDFGSCDWAENFNLEDKLKLGEKIVDELAKIHQSGRTWGETILPNIIITETQRPVIVDPETQYDNRVSKEEQRARDLKDLLLSISGAIQASEKITDYRPVVKQLLDRYPDREIIEELKNLVAQRPTFIQKIFRGFYETARLGINQKEYQKVTAAILEYK